MSVSVINQILKTFICRVVHYVVYVIGMFRNISILVSVYKNFRLRIWLGDMHTIQKTNKTS